MDGEISNFELLLTRGRGLGICFLVAEQLPSEICKAARVSAQLDLCFCTAGPELRAAAEILGLRDPRQIEQLRTLPKGECSVSLTGDRLPGPIRLRIPLPAIDRSNLSDAEAAYYIKRSLEDQLPKVRPRYTGLQEEQTAVKQREQDPNRLSRNAWRVFSRIADQPYESIDERIAALDLCRGEEESARKESQIKGYLEEAGTLGHGMRFFQLTAKGRAFADQHNIPVYKRKSSLIHEVQLRAAMRGLSRAYPVLRWTSPAGATGSTQPDAYALMPEGWAVCVQVHYRNKIDYEVQKLRDLCAIPHVDMTVLITSKKSSVEAFARAIRAQWPKEVPQCFRLLSATECLKPEFDWSTVLGSLS